MAIEGVDEAEVDRLYGLPLDRFTEERDTLARRLRQEGRRDAADAVKGLRKPSLAAWTVNLLARERPEEIRALLDAAEGVRRAHGAGPKELREATAAEREAVSALVESARAVLAAAGRPATEGTLDAVAGTLQAAAAAEETRDALERGRLERELEPSGFDALAGLSLAAPAGKRRQARESRERTPDRRRVEKARASLAEAQARARELRRTAEGAERAAKRARADADRAEAEVKRAEEALEAAQTA
jgi:hypothetical protein